MSVIIRLQKLPLTANASDVRGFFEGLSIPDGGVHIVGGEMGDAFIAFSTDEDARQAMALNGGRINNEPVSLLLSSRTEMQKVIDQARKAALSYMQLSRVAPVVAVGSVAARPKVATPATVTAKPATIPGIGQGLGGIAGVVAAMPKFCSPPPAMNAAKELGSPATATLKQKPQPPVISLAGFLATAQSNQMNAASLRAAVGTAAVKAPPSAAPTAAVSQAAYSPLLSQGSSYNEIPGLSFVGNVPATGATEAGVGVPALSTNGLTGWLSALNGQLFNKGPDGQSPAAPYLNGVVDRIDTSFLANSVTPVNMNGQQQQPKDGNSQSPWKFLKKDRRSRSPSRERGHNRDARSRSSSRERELKRGRRSRSSSRGRSFKRDGRSRSSSRDRGSRSWSRSSSRDYNRRYRNSRSRSSSRDRFGRMRHRSRSRSPRNQQSRDNSRDRSREPSGNRYDREGRSGRFSHFSGRAVAASAQQNQNQQDQWSSLDKVFTGNSKPPYAGGMNRQVEPIFGLHTNTGGLTQDQRSRNAQGQGAGGFFPARSGKISPPPGSNGGHSGGHFRNTSPLPDSVYSGVPQSGPSSNNGTTTSDYAVKVSNLETVTGYGELRRFFKSLLISTQGIKMINDQNGRRTGVAYIQFLRKDGKRMALQRDGALMRRTNIIVESITDQEFEQAIDSYRPGSDKGYQQQQQHQPHQQQSNQQHQQSWNESGSAPWNSNAFRGDGPWNGPFSSSNSKVGNNETIDKRDDHDVHQKYAPTSALMVWNLPTFTTEQDIMKMFSDFTVVEVLIVKNHSIAKQLDGYVRFHRQDDAKEAWSQMHRHYIGNKKVTVRMCPEIDYAVAKNEYENPRDTTSNNEETKDDEERQSNDKLNERTEHSQSPGGGDGCDQDTNNQNNNNGIDGRPAFDDCRNEEATNRSSQDRNNGASSGETSNARKRRWGAEKNWDDEQRAESDTNASWVDRDPRMNRDGRDNSQASDSNHHNGNGGNNGANSRDPRRPPAGGPTGRVGFGGNSVDNSELFQRTTCLLLRNVDYNVFEEDVFQFFAQDGFRAKSVLLVRNERGKRTGECLVEFENPSEAAHAESKSSQNLGRRKVFASHLDRGQVADLMKRFDAIAEGRRSPIWQQNRGNRGSDAGGDSDGRNEDPEDSQGVGCGPYRTATVGLLNLAYKTTVEDVQNFFREFDLPLENVGRRFLDNGQSTGEAMVRFQSHQDAEKALNEYQNRKLFGRNVRIRLINDD